MCELPVADTVTLPPAYEKVGGGGAGPSAAARGAVVARARMAEIPMNSVGRMIQVPPIALGSGSPQTAAESLCHDLVRRGSTGSPYKGRSVSVGAALCGRAAIRAHEAIRAAPTPASLQPG